MFDAIVVGARCAGSSTAMLLARKGYEVLLVDAAGFPSDTLSTHYIHQPGVAALDRWGLLERLVASGCPPIERQLFDVGPFALLATPPASDGIRVGYAPRRLVLDKMLFDAAIEAGAEAREHFSVKELIVEGGRVAGIRGRTPSGDLVEERAGFVVGADGAHSAVARMVAAPAYEEQPAASCAYYSYWSGVEVDTAELYTRPQRMLIAAPTHWGLTLTIVYWPEAQFHSVRADIEGHFMRALDEVPSLGERVRAGSRAERFRGSGDLRGFFRRPHGPGWALVGDAGYHKNPITAEGITDAFRDAELLASALDDAFAGRRSAEDALDGYERRRNEAALPIYRLTCDLARLEPPPPEMQALFGALRHSPDDADRFMGTIAGTVPIPEFFGAENVGRILRSAAPS